MKLKFSLLLLLLLATQSFAVPIGLQFITGQSHFILGKGDMKQLCIAPSDKTVDVAILISIPAQVDQRLERLIKRNKGKKLTISFDKELVSEAIIQGSLERQFFVTGVPPQLAKKIEKFYQAPCLIKTLH